MSTMKQEDQPAGSGNRRWAVLIINRVLDRPNQVRYQRIVALAAEFNLIVITKTPLPKVLEAMVSEVRIERSNRGVLSRALAECRRLKAAGVPYYVHTQYAAVPLLAGYACKTLHQCRWVYDLWDHPSLGWIESTGPVRWARQMFWSGALRRLVVHADAWIIAMHPGILGYMPPAPVSCRLVFMRPGYDGAVGKSAVYESNARPRGVAKVVYVGSVTRHRGLDLMVDWVENYQGEPVELHIAGPCGGQDSMALMEKLQRSDGKDRRVSVRILGEIGSEEVDRLLGDADIALSPVDVQVVNYRYAYPVKVIQYMSHGLIVVATESHGTRAVIDDGCNGFLSAYEPHGFRRAMARALAASANPGKRAAIRDAARKTAQENQWITMNLQLVREVVSLVDKQ